MTDSYFTPEGEEKKHTPKHKTKKKKDKSYYGITKNDTEGDEYNPDDVFTDSGSEGGDSVGESFAQTQVRKAAAETRSLAKFKERAEAAKQRKSDKDALHKKMKSDLRTKGIRFSDAQGKGYIKDGKKTYDA